MIFRRPTVAIALCLMWISLTSRPAHADLVLALSPNTATITVGQTFDVEVFLQDTLGTYLDPNMGSSGSGLSAFGFRGNFDPLVFQAISYDFPTAFDPPAATNSYIPGASSFSASAQRVGNGVVFDETSTAPPFSVSLGKVTLLALAPSAGSQLTLTDPNPSADNFFMAGTTGVDADVFGSTTSATFVVNPVIAAVPEPGSMGLVGLAGAGLWLVRRRQRRGK